MIYTYQKCTPLRGDALKASLGGDYRPTEQDVPSVASVVPDAPTTCRMGLRDGVWRSSSCLTAPNDSNAVNQLVTSKKTNKKTTYGQE